MNQIYNLSRFTAICCLIAVCAFIPQRSSAQLSSNPDKFLGNITTRYQIDTDGFTYWKLWNQITCENESKWASVEGTNNSFNWGCDNAYNYAKNHKFPFKFHALIWGSQYPSWIEKQTPEQRYKEIVQWMDAVQKRYPDLQLIDVVNEAISGHQAGTPYFIEALGGTGNTGYDWLIKAFELAYERWPDAILIYNDFNTFQWNTDQYIDLVKTLRNAGAPIDAYGCQSHDCTDLSLSGFKTAMKKLQDALKMPMYSTEYDIGTSDDNLQLQRYKEQIPYMWEQDYCAGITLWGFIYGATWTTDGNSGIIKNGKDRPAMTWLREYMASDKAKNAKSPFPGMVKEASVYIKPQTLKAPQNDTTTITVRARMKTKTIDHIDFYIKDKYYCTMTEAPYVVKYVPKTIGVYALKAVVTTTDSTKYERYSEFSAVKPRSAFKEMHIPGVIEAEDFDKGADGVSFHDSDTKNEGTTAYRTDGEGVDIVTGNGGYAIGYTQSGEWLEYTINIDEAGTYSYDATVSSGNNTSSFSLSLVNEDGSYTKLTNNIGVPCITSGNWNSYCTVHGRLLAPLPAGKYTLHLDITGSQCNIDKIAFSRYDLDQNIKLAISADPSPATVSDPAVITTTVTPSTAPISEVRIYQTNGVLIEKLTEAPFDYVYTPTAKGSDQFLFVAADSAGFESDFKTFTLKVNPKRTAFKGVVDLPGIIEAENFDKGGENFSFHDSDTKDEGAAKYRSDNEGVDIIKVKAGVYAIGYTAVDEWLDYTVNVTKPGRYTYVATVASETNSSRFKITTRVGDARQTILANRVMVPKTGTEYQEVTGTFSNDLKEGEQIIRITILGAKCNIDKIEFKLEEETGIEDVQMANGKSGNGILYDLTGRQVDENYKGIVIKDGKKYLQR